MKLSKRIAFLLCVSSLCIAQQKEVRGVWMTPRVGSTFWTKEAIAAAMDSVARANFNVVYFNAWSRGWPLFRSQIFYNETGYYTDPYAGDRDILQEAITEAHRVGIEIEAWMEYGFAGWWTGYPTGYGSKGPIFAKHTDWLAQDASGNQILPTNFYWFNHNHPQAQMFLVKLHQEIAKNYDIDGIELDRIRYPQLDCGYDSLSVARYKAETGKDAPLNNFSDPDWMRWRADQLNQFHKTVYDSIKAANPNVLVTNAPSHYGTGDSYPAYSTFLQDWKAWVNGGYVDGVQVQMYADTSSLKYYIPSALRNIQKPELVSAGITVVANSRTFTIDEVTSMIRITRDLGLKGNAIWYFDDLNNNGYFHPLQQRIYQTRVVPFYRDKEYRYEGMMIDEYDGERTSGWKQATNVSTAWGKKILYADTTKADTLMYSVVGRATGWFEVYAFLPKSIGVNVTDHAKYELFSDGVKSNELYVNQFKTTNMGWFRLGNVFLQEGIRLPVVRLTNSGIGAGKIVVADEIMLTINRTLSPGAVSFVGDARERAVPRTCFLYQNYPNPFNPETTIRYNLSFRNHVRLEIFDTLGREVAALVDGIQSAGNYEVKWLPKELASGVYIIRLLAGEEIASGKSIFLK